jgi:hypothetical protein
VSDERNHNAQPAKPAPTAPPTLEQIEAAYAAYLRGQEPTGTNEPNWDSSGDQAASFLLDEALPTLIENYRR